MAVLANEYDQVERIVFSAIEGDQIEPELVEWLDRFYRESEAMALDIYNRARMVGWRMYDRERSATFWKQQVEFSRVQLGTMRRTEGRFLERGIAAPPALASAIQTASDILAACEGAYELFA